MAFTTLDSPTRLSAADTEEIRGTAKWARMIAICGFILLGVMLVFAFFYGSFMSRILAMQEARMGQALPVDLSFLGWMFSVMMVVFILIYFFPILFLYQYASRTLKALAQGFDGARFSSALHAHRSFYSYVGVLTSVVLILNVFGVLIMGLGYMAMGRVTEAGGRPM